MQKLVLVCASCGVGKSSVIEYINKIKPSLNFIFTEADKLGLNCWDYVNNNERSYYEDCLIKVFEIAEDKNVLYASCINPIEYSEKVKRIPEVKTYFIALTCSDEELRRRLLTRPKERMCDSEEFIQSQITYNNWFKNNLDKFDLYLDTSTQSIEETVKSIISFVSKLD